jgi:hypothetical protein
LFFHLCSFLLFEQFVDSRPPTLLQNLGAASLNSQPPWQYLAVSKEQQTRQPYTTGPVFNPAIFLHGQGRAFSR